MNTAVPFSDNCDSYTDHASSIIQYRATHKKEPLCKVSGSIFSCQTEQYERPDSKTLENISDQIKTLSHSVPECKGLNPTEFVIDSKPIILGATSTELSGKDISERHMASNCADGFDIKKINTHNYYSCRNYGEWEENGKMVRNYDKVWDGILPSCEASVELSPQTEEDIRKLVQYRNKLQGRDMKYEDIACNIYGRPL